MTKNIKALTGTVDSMELVTTTDETDGKSYMGFVVGIRGEQHLVPIRTVGELRSLIKGLCGAAAHVFGPGVAEVLEFKDSAAKA